MKNIFKILFFAFLISSVPANLFGQLIGLYFDDTLHTNIYFPNMDKSDFIYIYNANETENNLFTKKGTLKAISPDGHNGWTFIWEKYDLKIKDYVKFDSIANINVSKKDTLSSGAYMVIMRKTVIDTFRAWIFINQLRLHLKKDSKGEVPALTYFCKYLPLSVIESTNQRYDTSLNFIHNDLVIANPTKKGTSLIPTTTPTVTWTADPKPDDPLDSTFSNNRLQMFINNAPIENTTFTINFTDIFRNSATDKVHYTTQNTKADFDAKFRDPASKNYILLDTSASKMPDSLDAPLNVRFKNKSKRGVNIEWSVADTFLNYYISQPYHFVNKDSTDSVSYTYYRPYTYKTRLISTSPEGCTDTSAYHKIKVANSQLGGSLHFPNAFSPGNNDQKNDFFTYKSDSTFSIKNLQLIIFNQWGKLVWQYNGPILYGWTGWNGKIGGLNLDASPGVYFFTYEAIGWGPIKQVNDSTHFNLPYNKKLGSGFVYLFRK
jgi:gliding motility-associated-like protein